MIFHVKHAITWREKMIGNIGRKNILPIYFETRWGIHTFGVKKPIDVIILDNKHIVRKLKENLQPNRIFLWNPKYERVLEVPIGTIKKSDIKLQKKVRLLEI